MLTVWAGNQPVKNEYVDTRGVWPVFVSGAVGTRLDGKPHTISTEDASAVAAELRKQQVTCAGALIAARA